MSQKKQNPVAQQEENPVAQVEQNPVVQIEPKKLEFLGLNDYCLERVFDFLEINDLVRLSKVCKRFNNIITRIHFPRQTSYSYNGGILPMFREAELTENLKHIGQYLTSLKIKNIYDGDEDAYEKLCRSVGNRLRKLTLHEEIFTEESLDALNPILTNLEELEINMRLPCFEDLDLRLRCPNLRRLHVVCNSPFIENICSWPTLEELVLGDNQHIVYPRIKMFMELNPQLRKLKIGCFNCELKLEGIAEYLHQLEYLVVFQDLSNLSPTSILKLRTLDNLKSLLLRRVKTNFDGIVNNVTRIKTLTEFQIQAREQDNYHQPDPSCIKNLAIYMPKLQVFGISFCNLKDGLVLEFLKLAENLREFHIHDCNFEITPKTIDAIVDIRKNHRNTAGKLIIYVNRIAGDVKQVSHSIRF